MDIEGYEKLALKGLALTLARNRPIVVVEISIDPQNPLLFRSKEDVQKAFPDRYEFLVYKDWDFYTGSYELGELDGMVRFDRPWQYEVVAYPLEKKSGIPRRSPR
jgi:hypothetical protein